MSQDQAIEEAGPLAPRRCGGAHLLRALEAFVAQGEPSPEEPIPPDWITLASFRAALANAARQRSRAQRRALAKDAWKRYLGQIEGRVAPQMKLADLVVALYESGNGPSRRTLLTLAREAPLVFGLWGGLKRVYKRSEADMDAEVFGVLAARFEAALDSPAQRTVNRGTLIYLQRRAWRFLRLLGKAVPSVYPQFAVEVLRASPATMHFSSIAWHVRSHGAKKWGAPVGLAKEKKFRAPYLEAWQQSADPLMLLLETCQADFAAKFANRRATRALPRRSPEGDPGVALPSRVPAARVSARLPRRDARGVPRVPPGKAEELGLHEAALKLLLSPSAKARKYAIEYARANAADLTTERLVNLLAESARPYPDSARFAAELLMARPTRRIGVTMLGRLLGFSLTNRWAKQGLDTEFERKELSEDFLIDMLLGRGGESPEASFNWAVAYLEAKFQPEELPLSFWTRVADDPRFVEGVPHNVSRFVIGQLTKLKVETARGEWILEALARADIGAAVGGWLVKAEALPPGVNLERIKGLVFDPARRGVAFALLGNRKLVSAREVGLGWLLALARRADPELHEWAQRYLLQHMRPENFAERRESVAAGVARLFALATGAREPEAVRVFAQTYLRCHHATIGRDQPESRQLGLKGTIPREEFTEARVWSGLFDTRADVRRFAVTIARTELRRWGAQGKVYELAEASAKEVRNVAYDALSQAGEPQADPDFALLPSELDAAQIFSLTESRIRATRDLAIELIRKHYARIGGATRLAWLMQSADREVRMLAVRLLWEKHRPRTIPPDWRPPSGAIDDAGPFEDASALRGLLRRLLFSLPPPRSMEALEQARSKKVSASVAKRNLVEIVRDLAVEDAAFAKLVAPVLAEFTGSAAKGEWQACLSALMTMRRVHGPALPEGG